MISLVKLPKEQITGCADWVFEEKTFPGCGNMIKYRQSENGD
jgi:hypothetical protein